MTEEQIWKRLYDDQIDEALKYTVDDWRSGQRRLRLHTLPRLEDVTIPHWRLFPIIGKSPEPDFWYRLSNGIFNVNMRLREESQLAYLEERDLFHDVFGHTPMLCNMEYSAYIKGLGLLGTQYLWANPEAMKALSNFYWVTAEFGLMDRFLGNVKVLGAGIISSKAELQHAIGTSDKIILTKERYDEVAEMGEYVTDGFQTQYYVLQDYSQLGEILKYLWNRYV